MLKLLIVLLLLGNLAALAISFFSLIKDQGNESKKTVKWLIIRVSLAVILIITVSIAVWTGDLTISAPWHHPSR